MKPLLARSIERYALEHTSPAGELLEKLEEETYEKMEYPQMLTGKVEGRLLQMLVHVSRAKKVVEIGTFTGYSAIMMAEGLPENGKLVTCEVSRECAQIARRYFRKSEHGGKIQLRLGPAKDTLSRIADRSVDFVFIDADKPSYTLYYEESVRILRKGGLIAVDNVLWSGSVLKPDDNDSRAIASLNERVKEDRRVEKVMLTIRDGVYLIRKK
ncbi:MAG: class I SAM-dependent methyltransferase [Nitrospiraceae bacterium]|nr:MAG: class I SAM-dependent methyltransferase [Nitrospiraceae bacterium]